MSHVVISLLNGLLVYSLVLYTNEWDIALKRKEAYTGMHVRSTLNLIQMDTLFNTIHSNTREISGTFCPIIFFQTYVGNTSETFCPIIFIASDTIRFNKLSIEKGLAT